MTAALAAAMLACSSGGGSDRARDGEKGTIAMPAAASPTRVDSAARNVVVDTAGHIVIRHERSYVLADGAPPFRFVLEARGPEIEALDVRLAIHDAGNTIRYQNEWPSGRYVMCESEGCALGSLPPAARDSMVRRELAGVLGDGALTRGASERDAAGASAGWWSDASLLPEVERHLARQLWLRERGRDARDVISEAEADSLQHESPALRERVQLLMQDLRGRPVFTYSTGSVGYCQLAWSPRERAIFDIDCIW